MGVGGSLLSVLTQFLSNRSQYVVVDCCRSKLVNVVSEVIQGSVLGPQLFLLYTAELFSIVDNIMAYVRRSHCGVRENIGCSLTLAPQHVSMCMSGPSESIANSTMSK